MKVNSTIARHNWPKGSIHHLNKWPEDPQFAKELLKQTKCNKY